MVGGFGTTRRRRSSERGIQLMLGDKAVNEEKDKVESAFKTSQTI